MDIARFKELPILGILRDIALPDVAPLIDAVEVAGLHAIEVTMNTPGAPEIISRAVSAAGNRLMIGAGTVTDDASLAAALDAGATFIVMPVVVESVIRTCVAKKVPVFPGALTPGEVFRAWQCGATMVKVFPAGLFGPKYFTELKGPFRDIELLACGGVTAANMREYLAAGASAVSFGASVFRKEWLQKRDFGSIGRAASAFVDAYEE